MMNRGFGVLFIAVGLMLALPGTPPVVIDSRLVPC